MVLTRIPYFLPASNAMTCSKPEDQIFKKQNKKCARFQPIQRTMEWLWQWQATSSRLGQRKWSQSYVKFKTFKGLPSIYFKYFLVSLMLDLFILFDHRFSHWPLMAFLFVMRNSSKPASTDDSETSYQESWEFCIEGLQHISHTNFKMSSFIHRSSKFQNFQDIVISCDQTTWRVLLE